MLTEQLQTALNNRITIEQAKGVLAHARNVDMDQAWELIRDHSRSRAGEIAHQLVTGQLPPDALPLDRHAAADPTNPH